MTTNGQVLHEKNTAYKLVNGQIIKNDLSRSYSGSLYLVEDFRNAKIITNNNNYDAQLRYNAYLDEMEIKENDQNYFLNKNNELLINFYNTNDNYQLLNYTFKEQNINGYLKILLNNKYSLLKREKIELIDANTNTGAFKTENYNEYEKKYSKVKDQYFIKEADNIYSFPNKINKLKEIFKNIPDLDKFIKKNNFNLNLEKDMITILIYINNNSL